MGLNSLNLITLGELPSDGCTCGLNVFCSIYHYFATINFLWACQGDICRGNQVKIMTRSDLMHWTCGCMHGAFNPISIISPPTIEIKGFRRAWPPSQLWTWMGWQAASTLQKKLSNCVRSCQQQLQSNCQLMSHNSMQLPQNYKQMPANSQHLPSNIQNMPTK